MLTLSLADSSSDDDSMLDDDSSRERSSSRPTQSGAAAAQPPARSVSDAGSAVSARAQQQQANRIYQNVTSAISSGPSSASCSDLDVAPKVTPQREYSYVGLNLHYKVSRMSNAVLYSVLVFCKHVISSACVLVDANRRSFCFPGCHRFE
jgi:hypothetical protein